MKKGVENEQICWKWTNKCRKWTNVLEIKKCVKNEQMCWK